MRLIAIAGLLADTATVPPGPPALAPYIVGIFASWTMALIVGCLLLLWSGDRRKEGRRLSWLPGTIGVSLGASCAVAITMATLGDRDEAIARYEAMPRVETGSNPTAGRATLAHLAGDQLSDVRGAVAANPAAPAEALLLLAGDPSDMVRSEVAANASAPAGALLQLASDHNSEIRATVAAAAATPKEAFWLLAADDNTTVRQCVGSNPAAPVAVLVMLAGDPDPRIRLAVTRNPAATTDVLSAAAAV